MREIWFFVKIPWKKKSIFKIFFYFNSDICVYAETYLTSRISFIQHIYVDIFFSVSEICRWIYKYELHGISYMPKVLIVCRTSLRPEVWRLSCLAKTFPLISCQLLEMPAVVSYFKIVYNRLLQNIRRSAKFIKILAD